MRKIYRTMAMPALVWGRDMGNTRDWKMNDEMRLLCTMDVWNQEER